MQSFQRNVCSLYKKNYNKIRSRNLVKKGLDTLFHLLIDEQKEINKEFFKRLGYHNNYTSPTTFNEKTQWLKKNDRTEFHTMCADKLSVREYIQKEIGSEYLIPLQFKTQKVCDLNQNNQDIKAPCIIKTNHDSGSHVIIKDNIEDTNWKSVRKKAKKSLSRNYYFRWFEWQYKNIEPFVIVEQLLLDSTGDVPMDYKFHCFNGVPNFIQIDTDRGIHHKRNFYDTSWNLLDFKMNNYDVNYKLNPKPKNHEKMLEIATKLSAKFPYVRIDLYNLNGKIYFGEITFHPSGGHVKFIPKKYDTIFGEKININM